MNKYELHYIDEYPFKIWLKRQGRLLVAIDRSEIKEGDTFHETTYRPRNVLQARDLQELVRDANAEYKRLRL